MYTHNIHRCNWSFKIKEFYTNLVSVGGEGEGGRAAKAQIVTWCSKIPPSVCPVTMSAQTHFICTWSSYNAPEFKVWSTKVQKIITTNKHYTRVLTPLPNQWPWPWNFCTGIHSLVAKRSKVQIRHARYILLRIQTIISTLAFKLQPKLFRRYR